MELFKDRQEAGERLASLLSSYKGKKNTLVIGLPRGGVVVAAVIARILGLPLDVIVPRKLGAPFNPELAIGAIAGGEVLLNEELIKELQVDEAFLQKEIEKERLEAKRREELFRKGQKPLSLKNKTVLLVDDGIATGATMQASILFLRKQKVKEIVVAVPTSPQDTFLKIQKLANKIFCPVIPENFFSISMFYQSFEQTSDQEVLSLLKKKKAA